MGHNLIFYGDIIINSDTKRIFAIALPLILQQIFLQLQIYVDRAFLGHVNFEFFSAIGNVLVPYYAIISVITAICTGTTILIAHSIGAKNDEMSKKYAEVSFLGSTVISLAMFLFFFFGSGIIFKIMGVQSPILEYSTSYLKILSFSLLIFGIYTTSVSIMQGVGLTKIIMITGIVSNTLNIMLDYILIFGKFGFSQMGIEGAALASVVSITAAVPIITIYVFKSNNMPFKINFFDVVYSKLYLYKEVLKKGLPTGLEIGLWNIGSVIIIALLNRLDSFSVGVYTLIFSIQLVPLFFYTGLAQATLTLVGFKTGEGEHKQAVNIGFKATLFSMMICVVFSVLFVLFPKNIMGIFTDNVPFIETGAKYFFIVAMTMFPKALNIIMGHGIRGMGDTKWMMYTQIFGTIFVVTLSYFLIFIAKLGLMGVFITYLADETIRGVINMFRFWLGRKFYRLKPLP